MQVLMAAKILADFSQELQTHFQAQTKAPICPPINSNIAAQ